MTRHHKHRNCGTNNLTKYLGFDPIATTIGKRLDAMPLRSRRFEVKLACWVFDNPDHGHGVSNPIE
jgi:hypothetical protein